VNKPKSMQNKRNVLPLTDAAEIAGLLTASEFSHDTFERILYTLHPNGEFESYISSTKTKQLADILKQIKKVDKRGKTAVFSQWTGLLDLAQKELKHCGIKCLRYDGSMNNADREAVLDEFSYSKEKNVLLISLKAGGVGLNLTSASNVVMLDLWWNPAVEDQAIDRVHRIGQKMAVKVYKLTVANTVEDRILTLQEQKRQIANGNLKTDAGMLGEGDFKMPKLTLNDLRYLFQGTRR
jgi:SNF2 family DNA or RNA helicase